MAEETDVLTLDEAKAALQIEPMDIADEDVLAGYVSATSQLLDEEAGAIVKRTVTAERLDGCGPRIVLRQRPVASITTITEYAGTTPTVLVTEALGASVNGYLADPHEFEHGLLSGVVARRRYGRACRWASGSQNVAVTYVAGRFEDTASVPARFKRAACITLENLWRDRQPGVEALDEYSAPRQAFPGFALPNAARQLLAREVGLYSPWAYR